MRRIFITVVLSIAFLGSYAQKVKVVSGSLSFLKGEETLNFVFDYSRLQVDGRSEAAFVAEKVKEYNQSKPGKGDEWKSEWETVYRDKFYHPYFFREFNSQSKLRGGVEMQANYEAKVRVLAISPGFMAGPFSKPAIIALEIIFTKVGSDQVLAKISITKAKTNMGSLVDIAIIETRIANAFGCAGHKFGKMVAKAVKK
jgi:hypothetical protein